MREAYWELRRRGGPAGERSPVELGRKFCAGCGRWRLALDFAPWKGRLRARCRTCTRRYQRQWLANCTPEQRERIREYARIWDEARRRRQGVPPRNFHNRRSAVDEIERIYLDPAPLVAELERVELRALSKRSGVPERSIDRILHGQSRHVRLDLADKLAVGLGFNLTLIYGPEPKVITGKPPHRAKVAA